MQVAVATQQKHHLDLVDLGKDLIGRRPWWIAIFEAVDGNSNGFITPAEFAALSSRLEAEIGVLGDFRFDFHAADLNFDGRIALQEWKEYAKDMERHFGKPRCLMAAWRFLGRREAVTRMRKKTICITEGYNMESSLQLLTICSKQASENLYDVVCKALEHQADPNAQLTSAGYNGYTPLIFLAMANSTVPGAQVADSIRTLIEAKADIHLEGNSDGLGRLVPLRFAAQMQNQEGLAALLAHIDVGDLFQWAAGEHVEHVMLQQLEKVCSSRTLSKIAGKAKYNAQATTLLIMFASPLVGGKLTPSGARKLLNGTFEGVKQKAGDEGSFADPNGKGIDGITALMEVAKMGHVETVKVLLEGRASPHQQDTEGATPLHFAAAALHSSVVKVLLEANADPSKTDHAGFSAYMLVGEDGSAAIGEDLLVKDSMGREEIIKMLRPQIDSDEVIDALECEGFGSPLVSDCETEDDLAAKLRLHETLFFDPLAIARDTSEGRAPRKSVLERCGKIIMQLLKTDPLKGKEKKLTKYLLQATMGPEYNLKSKHVRVPWSEEDNRKSYGASLRQLVTKLLDGFAAECDEFRSIIVKDAEANPAGVCGKLRALQADLVNVPEKWRKDSEKGDHWQVVQDRQLLRYDPEWARSVQNGATCCLALLRLGSVDDLSDYSSRSQVYHRPMEELLAEGYVRYSELCNQGFQELMCNVARGVVNHRGVNVTFPEDLIPTKKLKRLSEKTRDAREEYGLLEWPGRSKEFLAFSHCFYILDTVRLCFICNGETPQDEVACCLALFDAFKNCTVENEGLQMLRQKSGFAYGASAVGGYADVKLLVYADVGVYEAFDGTRIPLQIIGEVQLILHGYHKVKQRMHLAYEVHRGSFDRAAVVAPSLDAT